MFGFNRTYVPYGVLSGVEIAEAVARQNEYASLVRKSHDLLGENHLSWRERRRLAKLEKLPRIHIDGFDPRPSDEGGRLNPNSYNLDLAPELLVYTVPRVPSEMHGMMVAPEAWERYALDMRKDNPTRKLTIPPEGLLLRPDRLYLGRTSQHTSSYNCRPCLNGRSSIGRLGICIHITAGYGDVGFSGTWTLELMVIHPVRVYPGVSICQIDYASISPRHRPYLSKKYLNQQDVTSSKLFMDFADTVTAAAQKDEHIPTGGPPLHLEND